ncbi:MAG: helix-turn-helix domain-containing protein [Patescibacteria group bacterium]|nr:helix-turn-helix domain-containing protein [Patescibacteria group bacterium]
MIEDLLNKLDFNKKQSTVYLAVLKYGKITPSMLADITKLNRTTVYSVTKELSAMGVIGEDLGGPQLYLVAKPTQDLESLIKKEERKLEEKREIVKRAVKELQGIAKTAKYPIPKITFVQEEEVENHLYKATPKWDESILQYDGIWWGFQDQTFVQHYEDWIDWYWETGSKPQTKLKLLSNEAAEQIKKKKFSRREIRFWQESHDFQATTWILGDYVVMISTSQRPRYLVEIHDAVLAHDMREVFKGIWKTQIEKNAK